MIVTENGLEKTLFNAGTQKLAEVFNVDTDKQRIDSVHIQSNMRKLGRITIFSNSIHKFIKNLKRQHPSLFKSIVEISVKKAKQIPSDSLQNPSDPDAGYSGHKGQGYQVQIMETYTDTQDKNKKAKTLNLLTHVEVESAHQSDANALIPAIESTRKRDLAPKKVLADSLYGSDENVQVAKSQGVEVISPPMDSEKDEKLNLGDFQIKQEKPEKLTAAPKAADLSIPRKRRIGTVQHLT